MGPTQYGEEVGRENILEAVEDASGAENWDDFSVQALLLNDRNAVPQSVWKPEELERYDNHHLPCWVLRCAETERCVGLTLTQRAFVSYSRTEHSCSVTVLQSVSITRCCCHFSEWQNPSVPSGKSAMPLQQGLP